MTGPVTINDLTNTSQDAAWHRNESRLLSAFAEDESWTRQVWRRDQRFADLLPRVDATVYDIAVAGNHADQRHLNRTLPALQDRVAELAGEYRDAAVIRYVKANAGQSKQRTVALLQHVGILTPQISGPEAGSRPAVSPQRIYQLGDQIRHRIKEAQPLGGTGAWLPQDEDAIGSLVGELARFPGLERSGIAGDPVVVGIETVRVSADAFTCSARCVHLANG